MSSIHHPIRVLFTGYAPVHFACFKPLYERLCGVPGVSVALSGGLRSKTNGEYEYDEQALYTPFNIPKEQVLSVSEIRDQDFDVLFAANTKMIMPRSVTSRVQIFHGISFRNKAVRAENSSADYYFIVGPYMHRRFIEAGYLQKNDPRAIPIGFMKTDLLLCNTFTKKRVLIDFGFDGSRPVLLFAPTGQKHNSLETMGKKVICNIAASDQFDLIIKTHDHPKNRRVDWRAELAPLEGRHVKVATDLDVIPLLGAADLLITDASSVSNEYALVDRPIVFLDVPKLIKKAKKAKDSAVDLETWGRLGGLLVEKPEEIVPAIDESLKYPDRHSGVRRAMVEDLFYNPGGATNAAFEWFSRKFLKAVDIHNPLVSTTEAAGSFKEIR